MCVRGIEDGRHARVIAGDDLQARARSMLASGSHEDKKAFGDRNQQQIPPDIVVFDRSKGGRIFRTLVRLGSFLLCRPFQLRDFLPSDPGLGLPRTPWTLELSSLEFW